MGRFGGPSLFLAMVPIPPVVLVTPRKVADRELLKISRPKILHLHKLLQGREGFALCAAVRTCTATAQVKGAVDPALADANDHEFLSLLPSFLFSGLLCRNKVTCL